MTKQTLLEQYNELIQYNADQIIKSALSLKLLNLYSILYLNGYQPRWCESCQRDYFIELQKTGLKKIELMQEYESRTLIPNWTELKYIRVENQHFNSLYITDKQAFELLKHGLLTEKDFIKLPDCYIEIIEVPVNIEPEIEVKTTENVKKQSKKR